MPGPTIVVLVRHGESQVTVDQMVGGHDACSGLSKRGRRQAEALRDRLLGSGLVREATALYASILPRAVETARIIAPAVGSGRFQVEERCDLCELHVAEGDGLRWTEFVDRYGRPSWNVDPAAPLSPGSESWSGFLERAGAGLDAVAERHQGEMVVVACHGGVIEASFVAWGELPASAPGSRLRPENAGLTIWCRPEDRPWRLERYNDTAHLDGQEL